MPSTGTIHPLWSRFLVFSSYQVHGAYAHLHQHNNAEIADSIADARGPSLSKVWDPLRLMVPYQYLLALFFEPPDCCFGQWIVILTIVLIYMVPLCQGAAYLTYLCLFPLPPPACHQKRRHRRRRQTALTTTNNTLKGHSIVTFDMDGIPFIVDNSATCIITS